MMSWGVRDVPGKAGGRRTTRPLFGPPPWSGHTGRGSAAVASRRRMLLADGDLILHPLVQLVADALHLPEVLGAREGLLGPVLDDGLRLRRADPGKPCELVRARRVEVDPLRDGRRRRAGGDGAARGAE